MEIGDSYAFDFNRVGFALLGAAQADVEQHHVCAAELRVDGELVKTAQWPTDFVTRRFYLFWRYELPEGDHEVEVRLLNPTDEARVMLDGIAIYGVEPIAAD